MLGAEVGVTVNVDSLIVAEGSSGVRVDRTSAVTVGEERGTGVADRERDVDEAGSALGRAPRVGISPGD